MPEGSPFHLSTYLVSIFGKYICYALLALALDLIWGYCGILSLGHGAFWPRFSELISAFLRPQRIWVRGLFSNSCELHCR